MQSNAVSKQIHAEPLTFSQFLTRKIVIPFIFIAAIVGFLLLDTYRTNLPARIFERDNIPATAVVTKVDLMDNPYTEQAETIYIEYTYNNKKYNHSIRGDDFYIYTSRYNKSFPIHRTNAKPNESFTVYVNKSSPDKYSFESQKPTKQSVNGYYKFLLIVVAVLAIRIVIEIIDIIERWQNSKLVPEEAKKNIEDFDNDRGLFSISKYETPEQVAASPKQFSREIYVKEKDGWNKNNTTENTVDESLSSTVNSNNDLEDIEDIEVPNYLKYYSTKQFPVKRTKKSLNSNAVFVIIMILLHCMCLYRFANDFWKQFNYDQTLATITGVYAYTVESGDDDGGHINYNVTFSYTYDGQVYSGAYHANSSPNNNEIYIYVNPKNPNDYLVLQSRPEILIVIFFDLIFAAILVLKKLNKKQ